MPTLTQEQRTLTIDALAYADCADNKGTAEQLDAYRELEWRKICASSVYFVQKYGWIMLKSGKVVRFNTLFPCQIEMLKMLESGDSLISIKARQLGFTTVTGHFALWEILTKSGTVWNFFGADQDSSKDIRARITATLTRLPDWLRERASRTDEHQKEKVDKIKKRNTKDNEMSISLGLSRINLYSGAPNKVRGLSGKIFFDDFGKHENQEKKFRQAFPAIDDPLPENRGQMVIIFNGNGEDFSYALYQKAKQGDIPGMIPLFYSWRSDPRRLAEPIYDEAGEVVSYEWYERTKRAYLDEHNEKGEMSFHAEYPENEEEAFFVSNDSRFSLALTNGLNMLARNKHPKRGMITENGFTACKMRSYEWRLYHSPNYEDEYVIGIDTAFGLSPKGDASVMQVLRVVSGEENVRKAYERHGWLKDGEWQIPTVAGEVAFEVMPHKGRILEQVAVFDGRLEPTEYGDYAADAGRFFGDALVVPEENGPGQTVLRRLKDQEYWNIYQRQPTAESYYEKDRELYGFFTETRSKTDLINTLAEWLAKGWLIIDDAKTIKELSMYRYEVTSGGKETTNAPKGQHDDHVMALALAVYGAHKYDLGNFDVVDNCY